MAKDAKGHGSDKRTFEVRSNGSKHSVRADSISEAKEKTVARLGVTPKTKAKWKNPDSVVLKSSDPDGDRKKAIQAYRDIKGGKYKGVSMAGSKSINSRGDTFKPRKGK